MRRRALLVVAVVALTTATDLALLVALRLGAGWALVPANVAALTAASAVSWVAHRRVTFRTEPYVRWVRYPGRFALVAGAAGAVDTAVLAMLDPAERAGPLLAAKVVAVATAAVVRLVLYRALLLDAARETMQTRRDRPRPSGSRRATVVVPALDEVGRIGATVRSLREGLAAIDGDGGLEIVVVDDGSTDGTCDAALGAGADQVVVLPVNRGKGAAVRAGVLAARGRTVAFTDADLSYAPDQVAAVIEQVERGWDVAAGTRRHPGATTAAGADRIRDLGSRAVNLLVGAVLLSRPRDTQCGVKAFRADVARDLFPRTRIDGFAFDIELYHLVEVDELALVEVPVRVAHRERSTVRAARDGLRLVRDLWRIRHHAAAGDYDRSAGDAPPAGSGSAPAGSVGLPPHA